MPAVMRDLIANSFLSLAEHRNVDKITVKDLVDQCGISRQTFYYHFKDILEVIDWVIDRQINRVLVKSLEQSTPEKAIGIFVSSITGKREEIRRAMLSDKGPYIQKALYQALLSYLQTLSRNKNASGPVDPYEQEVALQFCAGGIIGVLLVYCEANEIDEEQVSRQLARYMVAVKQEIRG